MAELNQAIFNLEVNNHELLGRAYRAYLANSRTAQAVAKKRGQVRGGGRKPWQQKGTGRARIGSIRAPHWRGGGVTFGPTGDQNFTITVPTSAKRVAIKQALSLQNKDGLIKTFTEFQPKEGKTKEALAFLKANKAEELLSTLVVLEQKDTKVIRASANLQNAKFISAKYLNVYDILNADLILIQSSALKTLDDWLVTESASPAKKSSTPKASAKLNSEASAKSEPKSATATKLKSAKSPTKKEEVK
jgi:large subunit ribosomal protein L4